MQEELLNYTRTSPYFAQFQTEPSDRRNQFLESFNKLPEQTRTFLISTTTADQILALSQQYGLSEEHQELVARVVREIVLKTLNPQDVPAILVKRGIENARATEIADALLQKIITPAFSAPVQQQKPSEPAVVPGQSTDQSNIIDLRQQNNTRQQ